MNEASSIRTGCPCRNCCGDQHQQRGSIEVSSSYRPLAAGLPDLSQAGREQFTLKTLLDADVLAPAR
jgi:hypothetical protein